jgi:hypothetical protein
MSNMISDGIRSHGRTLAADAAQRLGRTRLPNRVTVYTIACATSLIALCRAWSPAARSGFG